MNWSTIGDGSDGKVGFVRKDLKARILQNAILGKDSGANMSYKGLSLQPKLYV
jgi:hypothetical protein